MPYRTSDIANRLNPSTSKYGPHCDPETMANPKNWTKRQHDAADRYTEAVSLWKRREGDDRELRRNVERCERDVLKVFPGWTVASVLRVIA